MSILDRKLRRDLYAAKARLAGVVVIITIGVAVFLLYQTLFLNLDRSRLRSYIECRMADFWVDIEKVPRAEVERLTDIVGVSEVRPRIARHLIIDLPGVSKPLTGTLVSMPADPQPIINQIVLRSGSYFTGLRQEEAIVSDGFARSHKLRPGDRLHILLNDRRQELVLVGTAASSEYSFPAAPGNLIPDKAGYGILYVTEDFAEEAMDLEGAANQIVGRLAPEYKDRPEPVLHEIERRLAPFGAAISTPLERQSSHVHVATAIHSYRLLSIVAPAVFLGAAVLILDILMQRMSEQQRTIVGTLKSMGHRNGELVWHFLKYGVFVGLLGGVLGVGLGYGLARVLMNMLGEFFEFTQLVNRPYPFLIVTGLVLSVVFSVTGTLRGVWIILQLNPAAAMRPKPPATAQRSALERWRALWTRMGFRWHLVIRGLLRHRIRVLTGVLCATVGTMLILFALSVQSAMDRMISFTFEKIWVSDVDLFFQGELDYTALLEAKRLPGVDHAEPMLQWFCTLSNGRHARDIALNGIVPSARLTVPRDGEGNAVSVPEWGVLLNRQLAEALNVAEGDVIEATPKMGRREVVPIQVIRVVEGYTGPAAYGDFRYINAIAGETHALNAVQTTVSSSMMPRLYQTIKELPKLQGYSNTSDQKRQLEEFTEKQRVAIRVMILFAGTLFGGSVLTASLVSLTERHREIATFRVLGYRFSEIATIFLRESLLINFVGIMVGLMPGYYLAKFFIASLSTEERSLPFSIGFSTWAWTIGLGLAFTAVANYPVLHSIKNMDWLDALNVKE